MKHRITFFFVAAFFLISCEKDFETKGKSPVYISYEDSTVVRRSDPVEFGVLGKINVSGNYIFINEKEKGIHVINNSDPENPVKEHFWQIPGNREFTIFQNTLYADNGKNLWIIDVTGLHKITVLKVIKSVYEPIRKEYFPESYSGYFECYDEDKGIFNGWKDSDLVNPLCKTN